MQTFYDIEIIFVDDCSNDNSILIIYELMKNDKRIKLYQNNINKGILYSKYIGVLSSKGKYLMILDQDDIYIQNDAFYRLFTISENYNLDLLGFSAVRLFKNLTLIKNALINYLGNLKIIHIESLQN